MEKVDFSHMMHSRLDTVLADEKFVQNQYISFCFQDIDNYKKVT